MADKTLADKIIGRVFGKRIYEAAQRIASSEIGEGPDHWKYRRLGPMGKQRNLPEHDQSKMLKDAYYLYRYDPLARRMLELTKDFVVGEGIAIKSKSPEVQKVVDRFWLDSINNMPSKQHNKCLELGLYGEQCYPVFVNEQSGHVRLGYLDPEIIENVIANPENAEDLVAVVLRSSPAERKKAYRIIHEAESGGFRGHLVGAGAGPTIAYMTAGGVVETALLQGSCFFFSVNRVSNATRGNSDLLPLIDWLFGFGDFLYNVQERQAFLWAFVWDVLKKGATEEQLTKWRETHPTPRPGSVWVHNEGEEIKAVTPDLRGRDVADISRTLRNFILGGLGIPEHWYSEGGYTNRATAQEMGEPSFKRLKARQNYFKFMLQHIIEFVLDQSIMRRRLPIVTDGVPTRTYFEVVVPDMRVKDVKTASSAILQATQGLLLATQNKWLTREKAAEVVAQVAAQFGVDVDVREVMEMVEEDQDYGGDGQGAVKEALRLIDERRERERADQAS